MNTLIKGGNGPIYLQIHDVLRKKIEACEFAAGGFLPTEDELAESFAVSVGTIKKALGRLTDEGLIERTRGRGTQVVEPREAIAHKLVLVVLGQVQRPFFAEIYRGIQAGLEAHNFRALLHDSSDSTEQERRLVQEYGVGVAGAIVAPLGASANYAAYGRLLEAGVPLLFVDRYLPHLNVDAVVSDNVQGGYLAARHLIELGHRRIAAVGRLRATSVRDRLKGYRKALDEAGVPFDPDLVYAPESGGYEDAHALTGSLRRDHPDVTAIVAMRDDAAWGCMQRLQDMGLKVPGDVSVIGFGDEHDVCERVRPRLSTIRQDKHGLGVMAAEVLIERMQAASQRLPVAARALEDSSEQPRIVSLPVDLVVRESTASPPASQTALVSARAAGGSE